LVPAHPEQRGGLQGCARTAVRLSVGEIRRLFWCLVLATQQRVERLLAWSTWRRWHQGIAKYWHYKQQLPLYPKDPIRPMSAGSRGAYFMPQESCWTPPAHR